MIKLYGHEISGNSYKARLMLSLLNLNYEWIKVDLMRGEHKLPGYLALNPFGKVPLLADGERLISDAQAILVYLARQYGGDKWLPEDARLYHLFGAGTKINIDRAIEKSDFILNLLEQHLTTRTWLELKRPTIADIAVFPYVALSKDAKISLDVYPALLAWIDRVKNLPGYIPMDGIY